MIAIGCDHTSLELKEKIKEYLAELGHETKDFGAYTDERAHYPIFGQRVAKAVVSNECEKGILICGSGIGISISANKTKGARCVVCSEPYSAMMSKAHNNTNILAFGSRVVGEELAKMIVKTWLDTEYEGGRHQIRVDMLEKMEAGEDIE